MHGNSFGQKDWESWTRVTVWTDHASEQGMSCSWSTSSCRGHPYPSLLSDNATVLQELLELDSVSLFSILTILPKFETVYFH